MLARVLGSFLLLSSITGCPKTNNPNDPNTATNTGNNTGQDTALRQKILQNVVDHLVLPTLTQFVEHTQTLQQAAQAWASNPSDATARSNAQNAWKIAMTTWQQMEMLHIGPSGKAGTVGGLGLREGIYAWPARNLCSIDQNIANKAYEQAGWARARLPDAVGLGGLEYALFVEGNDNACAAAASINRDGTWDALGEDGIRAGRAGYAAKVAEDVNSRAQELRTQWESQFADVLRHAGDAGNPYSAAQEALDALYAAIFYVELHVKDKKLAAPAGLSEACEADTCPHLAESRFAQHSQENIVQNLVVLQRILQGIQTDGTDAEGFDDLLRARGFATLWDALSVNLQDVIAQAKAMEPALDRAIQSGLPDDKNKAIALHDAVKKVTDDIKTSFPSALGLRVPDEGAGDND